MQNVVGGSSLVTKQRITAGMVDQTSTKVKPPVPPRRSSLSSLTFKKTTSAPGATSKPSDEKLTIQTQPEPSVSPVVRSAPLEYTNPAYSALFSDNIVQSPVGLDSLQDEMPDFEPFDPDMFPPENPFVFCPLRSCYRNLPWIKNTDANVTYIPDGCGLYAASERIPVFHYAARVSRSTLQFHLF
jgi:hypothetical protein